MSKSHRGSPLRKEKFLRGTCPVTGRTGVKLLYDHKDSNGNTIKVSKTARAKFKNIQSKETRIQKRAAALAKPQEIKQEPAAKLQEASAES